MKKREKQEIISKIQSIKNNTSLIENYIKEKDKKIFSLKIKIKEEYINQQKSIKNFNKNKEYLDEIKLYCEDTNNEEVLQHINKIIEDNNNYLIIQENKISEHIDEDNYIKDQTEISKSNNNRIKNKKIKKRKYNIFKMMLLLIALISILSCSFIFIKKDYNQELIPINQDELYGYKNEKGKFIIEPKYKIASDFKDDKAIVKLEDRWIIINKKGKQIKDYNIEESKGYKEGLAPILINGKFGFVDKDGNLVIEAKYEKIRPFSETLAAVKKEDNTWVYIDNTGTEKISNNFQEASDFENGLATVKIDGKEVQIDIYGKIKE